MNYTKLVIFSLIALFAVSMVVKADIAPPIISVNVTYNGYPVNGVFYSVVLSCMNLSNVNISNISTQQLNISAYDPVMGCYWTGDSFSGSGLCADSTCSFQYFPPSDFKIAFYLPDLNKTFITNKINRSNFTTGYDAQLYLNGSATLSPINNPYIPLYQSEVEIFVLALILTLAIELIVAFLYLRVIKIKKKGRILLTVVFVNIISVSMLWFVFIPLLSAGLGLILGEIFAVVFEGYVVYYFNKKRIKLKNAMLMSLIMNIASLMIGGLILLSL